MDKDVLNKKAPTTDIPASALQFLQAKKRKAIANIGHTSYLR